jgi:exodeoxyribonuclease V alpha subunit
MELDFLDRFFARKAEGDHAQFLSQLLHMSRDGHLCVTSDRDFPPFPGVIRDQDRYYLHKQWIYETAVIDNLQRLLRATPTPPPTTAIGDDLLPEQKEAVRHVLDHAVTVLCGGPGTGKSYTAARIAKLFHNSRIIVAAPTGKAAAHLSTLLAAQNVPCAQFSTIHHLLHLKPGQQNLDLQPIDADLLLIDEASMLDASLLAHLLSAVASTTRLVLIGDPNQLPPVGMGTLFADIADQIGLFLRRTMRTDDSALQSFADAVNRGDSDEMERLLQSGHPSLAHRAWQDEEFPQLIFSQEPDPQHCLRAWQEFRILCPLRQGPHGIDALNLSLLRRLEDSLRIGDWWAVPFLVTKNEPRLNLYNGSHGILIGQFQGAFTPYSARAYAPEAIDAALLPPTEFAFCLSVHKSQGSEFKRVVALLPPGSEPFGREALYTAVTRSKEKLVVTGELETLREVVRTTSRKASGFTKRFAREQSVVT